MKKKNFIIISITIALVISLGSVILWQSLSMREERNLEKKLEIRVQKLRSEITRRITDTILAMERMSERWLRQNGIPKIEWEHQAQALMSDLIGFRRFYRLDSNGENIWTQSDSDFKSTSAFLELLKSNYSAKGESYKVQSETILFPVFANLKVSELYIATSLISSKNFDGFILGDIEMETFFDAILLGETQGQFNIIIKLGDTEIYENEPSDNPGIQGWSVEDDIHYFGLDFKILLWPRENWLQAETSSLLWIIPVGGSLIGILMGLFVYFWQTARWHSGKVGALNLELEKHRDNLSELVDERTKELKKSHLQLLHSEKLASLGKLTGSISHEFNNPLQGIRNVISLLSESTRSDKEAILAKAGKKECDRMAKMIRGLRSFYKPTSGKFSFIDINQCLDEVLALQNESLVKVNIQVIQQFSNHLPRVEVVEDQIKQVILNIVQNAADSISGEGRITLTTEKQDSHVIIKIHGTGTGISEDDKENLFEPFFTTKGTEQGSGLGLSISYGIVRDHGGGIEVESELDKGTTFIISLPIKKQ